MKAETLEDRKLGALYVLTGLVIVSGPAADSYPWLVQAL